MKKAKEVIQQLAAEAGITLNGKNDWDPQIHDERFYTRIITEGSLGLGESYMDGWWDCRCLDQFFYFLLSKNIDKKAQKSWSTIITGAWENLLNPGRKSKAFEIGHRHYDIGNDLYQCMLDKRLTYTCGYWKDAANLDEAQESKLDMVCRKLGLKSGEKILDIGSGWGCFIKYAAERFGTEPDGITVSEEQQSLAEEMCCGLPAHTWLKDYREVCGTYDHVVSLGMIEHVGFQNYRTFMKAVHRVLKENGLFLLQTIGTNQSGKGGEPWIQKYIFPNSMLPSLPQLTSAAEGLFVVEDIHNFGADYDRTLMAWYHNFRNNWHKLKNHYGERFYRMWVYYLLSCAGSFRARKNQLWQIVFSKKGVTGGYTSIR